MKKLSKLLALTLALFVGITFSAAVNTGEAHAASVRTPGKVTLTSVKAVSPSQIKITWKKASYSPTGYQVYRGGTKVATTKNLSYTNSGLQPSTKYSYKVRAYKAYSQKQYYNTKYKKWVTKKPAAKYWKGKKTRKVTKYKYGGFSSVKSATTAAAPVKTVTIAGESLQVAVGKQVSLPNITGESRHLVTIKSINIEPDGIDIEGRTSDGRNFIYSEQEDNVTGLSQWMYIYRDGMNEEDNAYFSWYTSCRSGIFTPKKDSVACYWTGDGTEPVKGQADKFEGEYKVAGTVNKETIENDTDNIDHNVNCYLPYGSNYKMWLKVYDGGTLLYEGACFREGIE